MMTGSPSPLTPSALAAAPTGTDLTSMMVWFAILLVGMLALAGVVIWAKKKYAQSRREEETASGGLTIEDLEVMRANGKITREEFSLLRTRALGLDSPYDKKPPGTSSDPTEAVDDSTSEGQSL